MVFGLFVFGGVFVEFVEVFGELLLLYLFSMFDRLIVVEVSIMCSNCWCFSLGIVVRLFSVSCC